MSATTSSRTVSLKHYQAASHRMERTSLAEVLFGLWSPASLPVPRCTTLGYCSAVVERMTLEGPKRSLTPRKSGRSGRGEGNGQSLRRTLPYSRKRGAFCHLRLAGSSAKEQSDSSEAQD